MDRQKKQRGFTLIELMVTVTIAVILVTLAAPAFTDLLRSNRMTAHANDLLSMLALARSEAVKRGVPVYACIDKDTGDNVGWSADVALTADCSGTLIRTLDYSTSEVVLNASHTVNYGAMGRPANGAHDYVLTYNGCSAGDRHRREINVSPTGRATVDNDPNSKVCS